MPAGRTLFRAAILAGLVIAAIDATPASAAAAINLGFNEPVVAYAGSQDQQRLYERMGHVRANRVRIAIQWNEVASGTSVAPADTVASNPAWPGYRWDGLDSAVRQAKARGIEPLLVTEKAPTWAEGPNRAAGALPGTWRISPERLAAFSAAVARRYSGTFKPAGAATPLPAVRYHQVWNEPNLDGQLLPQNEPRGGRIVPVGADLYRRMLARSYMAIKGVSSRNVVVAAGLAPYGDFPAGKGIRTPPVFFARQLLCLSKPASGCAARVPFDVFAVNVYPPTPGNHAGNVDDLALADMARIRKVLTRAAARRTVQAPAKVPLWVTEFSWATRSPDYSFVVSPATQARHYVESMYRLWSQGVQTAFWWRLRDGPRDALGYQVDSGFFSRGETIEADEPKPIVAAAKLPFLVRRAAGSFRAWVLPAAAGRVTIERRLAGGWMKVATLRVVERTPVLRRIRAVAGQQLRARQGAVVSLPWTAR